MKLVKQTNLGLSGSTQSTYIENLPLYSSCTVSECLTLLQYYACLGSLVPVYSNSIRHRLLSVKAVGSFETNLPAQHLETCLLANLCTFVNQRLSFGLFL